MVTGRLFAVACIALVLAAGQAGAGEAGEPASGPRATGWVDTYEYYFVGGGELAGPVGAKSARRGSDYDYGFSDIFPVAGSGRGYTVAIWADAGTYGRSEEWGNAVYGEKREIIDTYYDTYTADDASWWQRRVPQLGGSGLTEGWMIGGLLIALLGLLATGWRDFVAKVKNGCQGWRSARAVEWEELQALRDAGVAGWPVLRQRLRLAYGPAQTFLKEATEYDTVWRLITRR